MDYTPVLPNTPMEDAISANHVGPTFAMHNSCEGRRMGIVVEPKLVASMFAATTGCGFHLLRYSLELIIKHIVAAIVQSHWINGGAINRDKSQADTLRDGDARGETKCAPYNSENKNQNMANKE